jgi:molybdopterin-guanine dinucleotide biosynthesis protein A
MRRPDGAFRWQAEPVIPWASWSCIVLAGGGGRRLGGIDKATMPIGGRTALDVLLDSLPEGLPVIVAGPERRTNRHVLFCAEVPPGGGPVAGIAAAMHAVSAPHVLVVATDMPWSGPLLANLAARFPECAGDVLVPLDSEGREQVLCCAWRTDALRDALTSLGDPRGRSVRDLVAEAHSTTWQVGAESQRLLADIDTPADLALAQRSGERLTLAGTDAPGQVDDKEGGPTMDEWIEAVRSALNIDAAVDADAILDVARVAAHNVARPAAPVTTYLLGLAVAGGADFEAARRQVEALADGWPTPPQP